MARTVRETFRQYLPGAGRNVQGKPVQGKTRVVGQINVTAYSGGSGEPLKATDLGLTEIDWVQLRIRDENSGDLSAHASDGTGHAPWRKVTYNATSGHFYLFSVGGTGILNPRGAGDSATETVEYCAEGDSSYDVELLS